jgi:glycosyltransferase involved in cell wall biosynthesis
MLREQANGVLRDRAIDWLNDADVLVLQRPMDIEFVEAIPVIQRQGVAVVVEIDDDFHSLPKGHPARKLTSPLVTGVAVANDFYALQKGQSAKKMIPTARKTRHNRTNLAQACKLADLVTVTTPALAERYGSHGRVRVIRNLVPARYLTIEQERRGNLLGWTGSTVTHVDDLRECGSGISDTLRETGARFRVVGTGQGVSDQLDLGDRPIDSTGWVPLREYPIHYARLDVAIAPLQLNPFNEAKSALKMIEAAALGVAVVGSPTSEYIRAAHLGLGMIASTPDEWRAHLVRLLDSSEFRADCAGAARLAAADLTYEAHAGEWWDAWSEALKNRRQKRAAA